MKEIRMSGEAYGVAFSVRLCAQPQPRSHTAIGSCLLIIREAMVVAPLHPLLLRAALPDCFH